MTDQSFQYICIMFLFMKDQDCYFHVLRKYLVSPDRKQIFKKSSFLIKTECFKPNEPFFYFKLDKSLSFLYKCSRINNIQLESEFEYASK
jgi:hypothetical protein